MSQVRCVLVGAVAACVSLAAIVAPVPALADDPPPPNLSNSSITCAPENAGPLSPGTTRPGDFVLCRLDAAVIGSNAYHVTADISIPAGTQYAPQPNAQGEPMPAVDPVKVFFDETKLGLLNPGIPKPASIRLQVTGAAAPGQEIRPVATLHDPVAPTFVVTSNFIAAMPRIADLHGSGTICENADPARPDIRAGETVDCRFVLANAAGREDATSVSVVATIPPGLTWAPGGNEALHFGINVQWFGLVIAGGVPSGQTAAPLHFRAVVDPSLAGGSAIAVAGTAGWVNALSQSIDQLALPPAVIAVRPGPAVLTPSTLRCTDHDAAPLLPGDLLDCTVEVRPAAGHEDLADASAAADVPSLTGPIAGLDAGGRIPIGAVAGTVVAGAVRSGSFQLRVSNSAVAGNTIVPTAVVKGRSVPSNTPVSVPVQAGALLVGALPAPSAPAAARPSAAAGSVAAAARPGSRAPVICGSRRVVTVNVRPPRGRHWKAVTFSFANKSVKGKKATGSRGRQGYFRARLVFQGLPRGPLTVAIKGVTTRGRAVRSTRTYNLCTKKKED
jgi:hypothetical protein